MANGIINYVSTFDDARILLNITKEQFNNSCVGLTKKEIAERKLRLIMKVLNNDWIPKLDGKEYCYVPYFRLDNYSFSYNDYNFWLTYSAVGFGWGFKNEELMMHCVNNFLDLWNDYLSYDTNDLISIIKK